MITFEEWFFKRKADKTAVGSDDETVVLNKKQPGKLPRVGKKPINLRPGDKFTKTDKGWHVQVNLDAN